MTNGPTHDVAMRVSKAYMDLSSAHELSKASWMHTNMTNVFALFAPEATYISEALRGSWTGMTEIQGMMCPFYKKYPDVTWEVKSMFVSERPCSAGTKVPEGVDEQEYGGSVVHVEVHFVRRVCCRCGRMRLQRLPVQG
eukprot:365725-Chlamydomonas_euryale.AAC.23